MNLGSTSHFLFQVQKAIWKLIILILLASQIKSQRCSYGPRGSLKSTCENATATTFRTTSYTFDNLDETVQCLNCNLSIIEGHSFDLTGNSIKTLDLSQSNITMLKENSFVGLVFLKTLLMPNNFIKTIIPGTFKGVKKIEYINLENNSIMILQQDGFQELKHLKILNLNNNKIKNVLDESFRGLDSLTELYLSKNEIPTVKSVFNKLKSLKILTLNSNKINSIEKGDLNIPSLLQLELSKNMLSEIKTEVFSQLNNLIILDLSYNPIDTLKPGSLKGLQKLENINLSGCKLTEIEKQTFKGLNNLKTINLSENKLTVLHTGMFSAIPELRKLNVSSNSITKVEATGMFSLQSLHVLDLSYNNLNELNYIILFKHLPSITLLKLWGNAFYCPWVIEMDNFFKLENIEIQINRDMNRPNCTKNFISKKTYSEEFSEEKEKDKADLTNPYIIYTFLFIVVILLGWLFFMQYKIMMSINYFNNGVRNISDVQLISSRDLEARENSFYNKD